MRVRHFCYYLTDWSGITPRPEDWTTNKIAKCVQDEPIESYVHVRVGGSDLRVDNNNKSEFLRRLWIAVGQRLAATLTTHRAIVPFPSGSAIISSSAAYRTLQYAQAIAAASSGKLIAVDALRWKAPAEAAYKQKGIRTPQSRYDNLTVIKCPKIPIILFDDVLTSGSSFIAANRRLSEAGNPLPRVLLLRGARRSRNQKCLLKANAILKYLYARYSLANDAFGRSGVALLEERIRFIWHRQQDGARSRGFGKSEGF